MVYRQQTTYVSFGDATKLASVICATSNLFAHFVDNCHAASSGNVATAFWRNITISRRKESFSAVVVRMRRDMASD